ncbi:hypothetical protein CEXT_606401 [Caerostris extrusa]|uniref:Uncharacterized protein n=1 Tax=Caerostris extrusa TaxID=172846 RepID=A0AAV4RH82_CAEEX|nr:hypothetical protein CEXT_606401 [Caerostris extrusa]
MGSVTVQLLQARSRITPMKAITILRLELMTAAIGARLFSSVKQALKLPNIKFLDRFFHTNSSNFWTNLLLELILPQFLDGIIRLVKLRTEKGSILRPIQQLYPLELTPNYEQVVPETQKFPEVVTEYPELNIVSNETVPVSRSGRGIKSV